MHNGENPEVFTLRVVCVLPFCQEIESFKLSHYFYPASNPNEALFRKI
jgi:hypothetical protein